MLETRRFKGLAFLLFRPETQLIKKPLKPAFVAIGDLSAPA
jgi:hypothetical protein